MERLIEVVAARLLEGSLVPLLGASLRRAVPHPPGPAAQAAWLAAMDEEVFLAGPAQAARAGDLPWVAGLLERRRGRRALQRLLREAYPPAPPPAPLHLLLASLPRLPLAISASLDGALLGLLRGEALEGARTLGLVHGVSPADRRGVYFGEAEGAGLVGAGRCQTLLYQPFGGPAPCPSYLVTEADLADALLALPTQAPVPEEVQRRLAGGGLLLVGCGLAGAEERLLARGLLAGAAGPHFAVLPGPPGPGVAHFLAAEGITPLPLSQERFVAELSRALAVAAPVHRPDAAPPGP